MVPVLVVVATAAAADATERSSTLAFVFPLAGATVIAMAWEGPVVRQSGTGNGLVRAFAADGNGGAACGQCFAWGREVRSGGGEVAVYGAGDGNTGSAAAANGSHCR